MNRYGFHTVVVLLCLSFLLAGCSRTRITASWTDPDYRGQAMDSILVLGISKSDVNRRTFEDEMVRQLSELGMDARTSYRTIPGSELPEKDTIDEWIRRIEADGVIVSRLVASHTERVLSPGYYYGDPYYDAPFYWRRSYHSRIDPYGGWYPYYRRSYEIAHAPRVVSEYQVYTVETTLYDLTTDQPIWSARAELVPDDNLNRMIEDFVDKLVGEMLEKNVI